ncbi:MAG: glycosyltransferase [Bacilli bacterium]|nr:glycosyltransferase [Bacilli bacterium]
MKLSIIFPLKNQTDKVIENIKNKVIPYFDGFSALTYEIIVSPNGSEREEDGRLRKLASEIGPVVRVLPLASTAGKGIGVKEGILASNGDYDLVMDADLATDLKAFDLIYPDLGKFDAFVADRDMEGSDADHGHLIRKLAHRISKNMVARRFGLKEIRDTQCGFKCFRHSVALLMVERQRLSGIAYDVEHSYFLTLNHYKIKPIPVKWENDKDTSIPFFSASASFSRDLRDIKKHRESYILDENKKGKKE